MLVFGGVLSFFGYSARVSAQQMIHQTRSEDDHDADTDAIESDVPFLNRIFVILFSYFFFRPTWLQTTTWNWVVPTKNCAVGNLGPFFQRNSAMCHAGKSVWKVPEVASTWASSSFLETKEILGWAILTILESLGGFFFWTSYWFKWRIWFGKTHLNLKHS